MNILIGKRQEGKTTHLIKMSAAGKGTIVAPTEPSAKYIKNQAKAMKLDIPEPISWSRLTKIGGGGYGGGPYLLDELGCVLMGLDIRTATLDDACVIESLSGKPIHYGTELAKKRQRISANFPILISLFLITAICTKLGRLCKPGTIGTGKRIMIFWLLSRSSSLRPKRN